MVESARRVAVVIGNPSVGSRTGAAATRLGERIASLIASEGGASEGGVTDVDVIEVGEHGTSLLSWDDPVAAQLKERVTSADALVVATPTYKASFTGLLKLFLDQFDAGELAHVPTVALMTGGSAAHSLAVQVHLVPVLTEIGASCPTPGLYLFGAQLDDPEPHVDSWFEAMSGTLRVALAPR